METELTPLATKRRPSSHISQQIPFYMLYYFTVYLFLLVLQLGMLITTVKAKWILPHVQEPAWIFPIDVLLVCMLVIEVGVHMFVAVKSKNRKGFFRSKERVMDFVIACLSLTMVVLDVYKNKKDTNIVNDGEDVAGKLDLFRDIIRVARIFEFLYILKEVQDDPDWYSNPLLSMADVL